MSSSDLPNCSAQRYELRGLRPSANTSPPSTHYNFTDSLRTTFCFIDLKSGQ